MKLLAKRYRFRHWAKRLAFFCFDLAGTLLSLPLRLWRKPLEPERIQRILVVRVDHIGDVVMTRPALMALHKRFPNAAIDLLIAGDIAPLLEDAREIRDLIPMRHSWFNRRSQGLDQIREFFSLASALRARHYDLGIDFRGDLRNILLMTAGGVREKFAYTGTGGGFLLREARLDDRQAHQVQWNLDLIAPLHVPQAAGLVPFTYSEERKKDFWARFQRDLAPAAKPRIVMHAGAGYPSKRWPGVKYYDLIKRLDQEAIAQVVLIGTEEEKKLLPTADGFSDQVLDLRGKTKLLDLPVLLDTCDLYVGNDSGPAHIAAAQGLEAVVLFSGTNHPDQWRPWSDQGHLVTHSVPCAPCEAMVCPLKHHDCMEGIAVDIVYAKIREILKRRQTVQGAG